MKKVKILLSLMLAVLLLTFAACGGSDDPLTWSNDSRPQSEEAWTEYITDKTESWAGGVEFEMVMDMPMDGLGAIAMTSIIRVKPNENNEMEMYMIMTGSYDGLTVVYEMTHIGGWLYTKMEMSMPNMPDLGDMGLDFKTKTEVPVEDAADYGMVGGDISAIFKDFDLEILPDETIGGIKYAVCKLMTIEGQTVKVYFDHNGSVRMLGIDGGEGLWMTLKVTKTGSAVPAITLPADADEYIEDTPYPI